MDELSRAIVGQAIEQQKQDHDTAREQIKAHGEQCRELPSVVLNSQKKEPPNAGGSTD